VCAIEDLVWYVSYGSNMQADRLDSYLGGGTPAGSRRSYAGSRDCRPPRRDTAIWLPGRVYFATYSRVWEGGRAFYDPAATGPAAARAWLITRSQFADILAQEMYRDPGGELDLTEVLATGRGQVGTGRYETVLLVGNLDGYPMLTFTAPWRAADMAPVAPSAAYLRMLAAGLVAGHGWDDVRAATYLADLAGVVPVVGPVADPRVCPVDSRCSP
jgi:hypothetical protein